MTENNGVAAALFYKFFALVPPRPFQGGGDVLPHSPIQPLAPNLWHVTGVLGFTPREMIIYKLPDSSLLIHSAIALDAEGLAQLESLGTPKILIVPNRIHRLDAKVYKERYPDLWVVAPAAAKPYVEEVVPVDAIAEEVLPELGIICHQPLGIRPQELVYELPLANGRGLVFTDILFNLTDTYLERYAPHSKVIFSILGARNYFGITALGQRVFMTDRAAYRDWLRHLADAVPSLCVISVAHGEPITTNCAKRLRQAADRLQ